MTDVRALLRNELAVRRGHDADGTSQTRQSKKRKLDSEQVDIRKRQRPTESPSPPVDKESRDEEVVGHDSIPESHSTAHTANQVPDQPDSVQRPPGPSEAGTEAIDDDEWAAFEREVAAPSREPAAAAAALSTNATISAAPVSASELAEREQRERESQATAQETRVLGEREDATRHMEEEFDEMEELEEKVRRLKEKRNEIRRRKEESITGAGNSSLAMETERTATTALVHGESEEESGSEDDWDSWRFRRGR